MIQPPERPAPDLPPADRPSDPATPPPPPVPSAGTSEPLDDSNPPDGGPQGGGRGALSQWQLIRRGFAQHRLARASLCLLVVLYAVALGAEFFATRPARLVDTTRIYTPPQPLLWSPSAGLFSPALERRTDPETLRRLYVRGAGEPVPLTLWAPAEPYRLLGVVPMAHRLIGVDTDALSPAQAADPPAWFPLGSDKFGRCVYSRIVVGSRVSLSIGLVGVACTFVLGLVIGGVSGYAGGRTDTAIQRVIEVINALPQLPLWIALAAVLPPDWSPLAVYFAITIVLSLLNWTQLARVVRGKILALREEDYAVAARLLGTGHGGVLFRHLVPGFTSHILVSLTLSVPVMILGETALSFLGIGLRPPVVSWGVMLQDCIDVKAVRFFPWLLSPVGVIVLTVMSFNFLGDGLRDAADPYAGKN